MRLRQSIPLAALCTTVVLTGVAIPETSGSATTAPTQPAAGPPSGTSANNASPPDDPPSGTPEQQARHVELGDAPRSDGSREVTVPHEVRMVGFTWHGAPPQRVRISTDRGPWQELDPAGDAGASEATGSEPAWIGDSRDIRVRARTAGSDVTDRLRLVLIAPGQDPTGQSSEQEPRGGDDLAPGGPPVVSRAEWGADESLATLDPQPTTTKAATVHHTAGTNDYDCAESAALLRGVYRYHAVELGWGDVGYHALVDKCGTIFEGRRDGISEDVVGAHAAGFNSGTFGVSMMGNHVATEPTESTVDSVGAIVGWKLDRANVPARGRTELVSEGGGTSKYPKGERVPLPNIFAHRDVGNTACPGDEGYARLDQIRTRAEMEQGAQQPAEHTPTTE